MIYLDMEEDNHSKQEFYFAQIAAEIRRPNVKNPRGVRLEDFLIRFEKRTVSETKEVGVETMMESHKRFWFAAVGLKSDGSS